MEREMIMAPQKDEEARPICVAALYRFAPLPRIEQVREPLKRLCDDHGIKGTLLLASEGINGTIAGSRSGVNRVLDHIRAWPHFSDLDVKYSSARIVPFCRMKVRIKQEIVTMGRPDIDPVGNAGTYVDPIDWNALIDDPDTIVIDTRNDYEISIGSFAGAINPMTGSFREFPQWFEREGQRLLGFAKPPRVAMFCTGGIRCEKASAFLKSDGIEDVYHLKGGILAYLEHVSEEASRWRGECFVFDQRVAVGHALSAGTHELCFACRRPVSQSDRHSPLYEVGVSCSFCHGEKDDRQRASYRERHRQELYAARQGRAHVGARFETTPDDNGC